MIFNDGLVVTAINFIGQILGFVSTALVAQYFGANWVTDAYYLALVIPVTLIAILGGTLKIIFVPIFVEEKAKEPDAVGELTQSLVGSLLLLSFVLSALTAVIAITGIWNRDSGIEANHLTNELILWLIPLIPLTLLRNVLTGVYVSYQRFGVAEFSNLFRYIGLIGAIIFLQIPLGIYALVVGEVIGVLCGVLLAAGAVRWQLALPIWPKFNLTSGLKRMLRLAPLPAISYMLLQLNPLTIRFVASLLPEGSVSAYSYAEKLAVIPSMLVGSAFIGVLVSHWSKLAVEDDDQQIQNTMGRTISMLVTVIAPAMVGLFVLRDSVVRLLLQRGQFDAEAAAMTAATFGILLWYVLPFLINSVMVRILFVRQDVWMFFLIAVVNVLSIPCFAYLFAIVLHLGAQGLALATAVGSLITMLTTASIVHYRHFQLPLKSIGPSLVRVCVSCIIMAFLLILVGDIFHKWATSTIFFGLEVIFGALVLYISLRFLRHSELLIIQRVILEKINYSG